MIDFFLNDHAVSTRAPIGRPLLDYLRRDHSLTAAKEGCREGDCGTCLVLLGSLDANGLTYRPVNSCLLPLGEVHGKHVLTVEGLNRPELTPVQKALVEEGAIQCGFCTPGLVIALSAYLLNAPRLDTEQVRTFLGGNLCRCTGYAGIRRAAAKISAQFSLTHLSPRQRIAVLIDARVLPTCCSQMAGQLGRIPPLSEPSQPGALRVGGGTDLWVQRGTELEQARLNLTFDCPELHRIREENGQCLIGAATSAEEIRLSAVLQGCFTDLARDFAKVCSESVRQFATVGGNLVNASPIADMAVLFLALDAELRLTDGRADRWLPLRAFYRGYKQLAMGEKEWIEALRFRLPPTGTVFSFEKISKRRYLDIASVNSAMQLHIDNGIIAVAHLSAGGVAPYPLYLIETCRILKGRSPDRETLALACDTAMGEVAPVSDVRGSSDYKRLLLRRIITAHFIKFIGTEVAV
ncbi:Xanthine dehydrogenase, iron-sulfur cluster and FAD-binding subunit A [Thioalkalivibrio nitratireducens DSM 14787]|uniref:Xanthine dehydrogenase, iron-sulfur cluster and FAD-binding subunit A n=1 Tax=Thioalkalivibrio nitratireducens (strain DSM 14787 / UNIQEM 213 / ALEN2) TaxID=1255043 RepID=L0DWI0_THIND|nr:FAD binding domain-containing protein [Thioalkalivibrio nitratireducens]AGA33378.1 Xanthine dehydrogenase, iron-sulfur cluster and FAD-binding subunit A [Thioalkalivibrio nitratireducens DSM 14787]